MNIFPFFIPPVVYYAALLLFSSLFPSGTAPVLCALVCLAVFLPLWKKYAPAGRYKDAGTAGGDNADPGRISRGRHIAHIAAAFAAGGLYAFLAWALIRLAVLPGSDPAASQAVLFSLPLPLLLAGPGFLIPVCEELIYRGFLQTGFKFLMPVTWASLLQVFLFAIGHGSGVQVLYAFSAGLIMTFLCEHFSLAAAISFHIGANICSIAGQLLLAQIMCR